MPNPKGNPESLKPYKLTTNRSEPLKIQINVPITESMNKQLSTLEDKNEFIRVAIQEKLDRMISDN